jgi:hypothetical protein
VCDYALQFTITYTLVFTVTSFLPLFGNGSQRRMSLFLCISELFPAWATSVSQQQLTITPPPAVPLLTNSSTNYSLTDRHAFRPKREEILILPPWSSIQKDLSEHWHLSTTLNITSQKSACLSIIATLIYLSIQAPKIFLSSWKRRNDIFRREYYFVLYYLFLFK